MIKRLISDEFLKNNIIFFAGSMVVAFLNYLYHPVLGRLMSVEDFGEVQSLISLFIQLSIFAGVFSVITVNVTANSDNSQERNAVISALRKIAFYITGAVFLIIVLSSVLLKDFFQFSSFWPFISLAFLLLISVSFTFRKAFLQGISDFRAVSWSGIIFAAGRLGFAVLLVYLGWRSLGAISGLLIAQGLALFYVYFKTKKSLNLSLSIKKSVSDIIKKEYKYAALIFLATLSVTFLYTADVLMVKHWFSPEEAGLYSGIATIARIIFFATGSVSGVLLAAVKLNNSPAENRQILKKGLAINLLIAGGALFIFIVFSDSIINLLIGSRYAATAHLLPQLSLLLALVSLINLLFFYFLALRRPIIFPAAFSGPALILALSFFRHESVEDIIVNFLLGSALTLTVLLAGIYRKNNSSRYKYTNIKEIP